MDKVNWELLRRILDGLTPMKSDCGLICEKKCCSVREDGQGMYLFPGEEIMYPEGGQWYNVGHSDLEVEHFSGKRPFVLQCRGICPREERPMACRIFPLAPYLTPEGDLEIVLDDDALFLCPLVRQKDIEALDPAFRQGVRKVWAYLLEDGSVREAVKSYSARIDDQSGDPWRAFLK